jgi:hypothetical protein
MISDSFLFDAGSIFFAAWIAVIAAVSLAAFGRELLPTKARLEPAQQTHAPESMRSGNPGAS